MKQINIKQLYLTPFHQLFKKRISGGCFRTFTLHSLNLLFLTFSISPFRRSLWKSSMEKAVLKVFNIHSKMPMLVSLVNEVQGWRPATLLKRDFNTVIFLWKFLFTNSYIITCFSYCMDIFSKNDYKRKNETPIKRAWASSSIKGRVSGEFWWCTNY